MSDQTSLTHNDANNGLPSDTEVGDRVSAKLFHEITVAMTAPPGSDAQVQAQIEAEQDWKSLYTDGQKTVVIAAMEDKIKHQNPSEGLDPSPGTFRTSGFVLGQVETFSDGDLLGITFTNPQAVKEYTANLASSMRKDGLTYDQAVANDGTTTVDKSGRVISNYDQDRVRGVMSMLFTGV
jgi:hypothetical protein